jgi:RHS repeat-associated protein
MVNAMSDVLSTTTYSPYGVPDSPISGFAFTGEQRDTNGLQYHHARYYNAGLGTWASLDPFEGIRDRPMSLNGYAWVEGNVMNGIDPSGLCATEDKDCQTYVRGTEAAYGVQVLSDQQSSMSQIDYQNFCNEFSDMLGLSQPADKLNWTGDEVIDVFRAFAIFDNAYQKPGLTNYDQWTTHNNPIKIVKLPELPNFSSFDARTYYGPRIIAVGANNWSGRSRQERTWLILHEFMHILAEDQVGLSRLATLYGASWNGVPTRYARTSGQEFLIEAMTGTVWNAGHSKVRGFDAIAGGRYTTNVANINAQRVSYATPPPGATPVPGQPPQRISGQIISDIVLENWIIDCVLNPTEDCRTDWITPYPG